MRDEQRRILFVMFDNVRLIRHQHINDAGDLAMSVVALDNDAIDIWIIEVSHSPQHQIAFLMDEARRDRIQRALSDTRPQSHQVVIIAADFGFGAFRAGRPNDQTHAFRHVKVLCDLLQSFAVRGVGDLAGDAAATCGVRHQNAVTPGQRQIGRDCRALIAAFFLDDLDQKHLAAFDDFLDLVTTLRARATTRAL